MFKFIWGEKTAETNFIFMLRAWIEWIRWSCFHFIKERNHKNDSNIKLPQESSHQISIYTIFNRNLNLSCLGITEWTSMKQRKKLRNGISGWQQKKMMLFDKGNYMCFSFCYEEHAFDISNSVSENIYFVTSSVSVLCVSYYKLATVCRHFDWNQKRRKAKNTKIICYTIKYTSANDHFYILRRRCKSRKSAVISILLNIHKYMYSIGFCCSFNVILLFMVLLDNR